MEEEEKYDLIGVDVAEPRYGIQLGKSILRTHGKAQCAGPVGNNGKPICCIHNPSDHHMLTWPQNWRGDKGMMERLCHHGIGHPDPDDLKVRTTSSAGVHGCDGCCAAPEKAEEKPCPNDTNGDGDCGRRFCPYCGGGPRWNRV